MELTLVDLAELGLPLLDEPEPAAWGRYARDATRAWSEIAGRFDAFVLVTTEYNHSTSAALKTRSIICTPSGKTRPSPSSATASTGEPGPSSTYA
jgi:hypothetical protein